jgi:hypothetical protein
VECKSCGKPATGACSRCGHFFCEQHGGEDPYRRASCTSCYDKTRSLIAAFAVVAILVGLTFMGLGVWSMTTGKVEGTVLGLFLLLCGLLALAAGIWQLGNSRKEFPKLRG